MNSFNFISPTRLCFGNDSVAMLSELLKGKYSKIMLHYGSERIKKNGLYDEVIAQLNILNVDYIELSGVEPNPKYSLVKKGIDIAKRENVDFVLAIGGGSVIDSAKAIAAGAVYDGELWDAFMGKTSIEDALPLGVILTYPATGSESSMGTVVTNEDGDLKRSIDDDLLRPVFAIMNPELTLSLPYEHTMAGITDIISHILERYFTQTENVDLTDNLSEAAIRTVMRNARILNEDLNDYNARAEIMISGTIAHNGVLGLGREDDWASHRIGHEITGLYGTTHGVTLAIIFPAWMKYVYKENTKRFARFAVEVFNIDRNNKNDEELAKAGIAAFEDFLVEIGMPTRLSEADIPVDQFALMAEKCCGNGYVGSFRKLYREDVEKIYELAK
ncbi:MAG: iron-containing alcohol dehydrogenase [Tissierellia bacterium]|nr:iron-containing alcohol dehydrogenase [Tissierellia bacterium]